MSMSTECCIYLVNDLTSLDKNQLNFFLNNLSWHDFNRKPIYHFSIQNPTNDAEKYIFFQFFFRRNGLLCRVQFSVAASFSYGHEQRVTDGIFWVRWNTFCWGESVTMCVRVLTIKFTHSHAHTHTYTPNAMNTFKLNRLVNCDKSHRT